MARAYLTIPITKRTQQADGSVIVEGPVTDESLDLDGQIVDGVAAAKALQGWFDEWGNVRQQHSPILAPAGKAMSLVFKNGVPWIKALIVDDSAVKLVLAKIYQAFSIGIGDGTLDTSPLAKRKARNGILFPSLVNEVSIVDYPANVGMGKFSIAKRAKDGAIHVTGKIKVAEQFRHLSGDSLVEALKGVHSGAIVHTAKSEKEAAKLIGTQFPESDYMLDGNVIRAKRQMDPDVGGGVDRDTIPKKDFAGKNRTFPIVKPGDVSDAASSIGRAGDDNYSADTLKANIIAIAQRKGPEFVSELPKKWRKEMGKSQKSKKADKAPGSKKPFPGAAPPFTSKDDDTATDDKTDAKKKSKKGKIPPVDQDVTDDLEKTDDALQDAKDDQAKDNEAHVSGDDGDDKDTPDDDTKAKKSKKGKKLSKAAARMAKESAKARAAADAETAAVMKAAHDVLCPLYKSKYTKSLDEVATVIDPEFFRQRFMSSDKSNVETVSSRKGAYDAAAHLATLEVKDLNDLRRIAHKAFTDAYPDVKVASPDLSDPKSFQRGFIASATKETATATSKPSNFPDAKPLKAGDFTRGPLTTNEARPTLSTGTSVAMKGRQFYTNADKDKNQLAMATLHDHIATNYPSVCPAGSLADETGDRLGTPGEMYSPAPGAARINAKDASTLVGVGAADTARAVKRAVKAATKSFEAKSAKQAKKIAKLEKSVRRELAQPDYAKSANRRTEFAPVASEVTPITEKKRERLERAQALSKRIHDRHSGSSQDDVSELQELVSPEQFAALMTAED